MMHRKVHRPHRPGFFTRIWRALFEKKIVVSVAERARTVKAVDAFERDQLRIAKIRACERRQA